MTEPIRPSQLDRLEAAFAAETEAKRRGSKTEIQRCVAVTMAVMRESTHAEIQAYEDELFRRLRGGAR